MTKHSDDLGHVICWCWSTDTNIFFNTAILLEYIVLQYVDKLHGEANIPFQLDLAPAHSDNGITVLNWPANWPDLKPSENLGRIVKTRGRYET